jgi:sec-independent protein translocase protein TatA
MWPFQAAPQEGSMGEFSPWHWLLVIAIALLLFAPTRFASLGKSLAEGIRSFKSAFKEGEEKKDDNTEKKS